MNFGLSLLAAVFCYAVMSKDRGAAEGAPVGSRNVRIVVACVVFVVTGIAEAVVHWLIRDWKATMRNSINRGGRFEHLLWLSGLVLWLATLSLPAGATDELVADRTLLIEPTEGFCALDLTNTVDSLLFEYMANLQKDYNQLVGYWVECRQLERVRSRETETLDSYVLVLAQRQETGAVIQPVDMPLGGFLSTMKDYLLHSGGLGKVEEGYELGKDVLDDQGMNLGETRSLGLIADDASALYLGNVQGYELNGVTAVMACVIAMTELNGIVISVNVYETYQGAETIEIMQRRAATIAAELVDKNPTVVH